MRIHYFQHVEFEGLYMIEDWIKKNGYSLTQTKLFEKDFTFPSIDDFDALIILGGPMSVYDNDKPWLQEEKEYIKKAIFANKKILGLCLGGQLIAEVLGGKVAAHTHKEIGIFPIQVKNNESAKKVFAGLNNNFFSLCWHSDRFEIPQGAIHLASSLACDNQAFLYKDRVLALQFHLEMNICAIKNMLVHCGYQIKPAQYIQDKEFFLEQAKNISQKALFIFLDNWIKL